MSDAEPYRSAARIPVERQQVLAWLREQLWWDARLADLEARFRRGDASEAERRPPGVSRRGAA